MNIRGLVAGSFVLLVAITLAPAAAHAAVPALQVTPLQYSGTLHSGHLSQGFVDVANPTDATADIQTSVKAWRQTGHNGDLQFYDNPDFAAGIKVDLTDFTLGPREAIRVAFTADPSKLPRGGVYAAIFFRTKPPAQSANSSYVVQSANVGTLLILTNGPSANHGSISLKLPFWQFGSGLRGAIDFTNTDHSQTASAVKPALTSRILPWGHANPSTSGLVLPGYTRHFALTRPGSYLGLLPVTITDPATHAQATSNVLAVTGACRWLVPLLLVIPLAILSIRVINLP
jgi:hypothetical protein